jgi:hypothetical protein
MHVDEAGKHVHARCVDLMIEVAGLPLRLERKARGACLKDTGDLVAFDDDVDRSTRRSAGSVDQHRSSDDHLPEGDRRPHPAGGAARD